MNAHKTDKNQKQIVANLRAMGMSVAVTSSLGYGFPDICVGYRGNNYLFEIKDPKQPPSGRKLTPAEDSFHSGWRGSVHVITTIDEAIGIIYSDKF